MSVLMGKRFGASLDFLFSLSCKRHCVGSDVGMTVCRPAALRQPRSCLRQRAASVWEAELSGVWMALESTRIYCVLLSEAHVLEPENAHRPHPLL